jgi:flagellar biosynthesis protein FlhG
MGAGATNWSLQLLTSVEDIIVISTAEPTSIMDAYSMMKYIHLKDAEKNYYLLCNRAFNREEGEETLVRLEGAMQRFLQKSVMKLGALPEDPVVRKSVREQVPFAILYPDAPISKAMKAIVERFINHTNNEVHVAAVSQGFIGKLRSMFSKGRD